MRCKWRFFEACVAAGINTFVSSTFMVNDNGQAVIGNVKKQDTQG